MKKRLFYSLFLFIFACVVTGTAGCQVKEKAAVSDDAPVTILIAAAASLKNVIDERLIPLFETQFPHIQVEAAFNSSGKLKTQIEEGLNADLFFSASSIEMDDLAEKMLINKYSVTVLLENELVLILPADSALAIDSFEDLSLASVIAIGDPKSVPAGQYAEELLVNLKLWDSLKDNFSLGTNVTEVLNWVSEGAADAGIVYFTDAKDNDRVKIVTSAPEGSLKEKILYPAGITASSTHQQEAGIFLNFLKSQESLMIFAEYGFTPGNR